MTPNISTATEEQLKWMVAGATVECFRGLLSNHAPCQVCYNTGHVFALPDAVREYDYEPTDDRWAYLEAAVELGYAVHLLSFAEALNVSWHAELRNLSNKENWCDSYGDTAGEAFLRALAHTLEADGVKLRETP